MKRFVRREYENTALVASRMERVIVLFWTRRGRKSTTLGSIAFDEMSKEAGRSVISASASLLIGTELINMTVTAAEQAFLVSREAEAVQSVFATSADAQKLDFRCANAETGKEYRTMSREEFAELYSSKKLEMRLYHSETVYSRQLVIAPNPATARGWRGTVFRDEAGFTAPGLETQLREAVDPIFRDVPDLKMIYASNLPRDDRHPFFEMTMPQRPLELEVNPAGNFYRGQNDLLVHRVTLQDAYAAGHRLYDNKGREMSYEEFSRQPGNKPQMPYNYDLEHKMGGSSAIDLLAMLTSQTRGARTCAHVPIEDEADFRQALDLLPDLLGPGEIGVGMDPATTTKKTSNPTGVTVTERVGLARAARLILTWKERDPKVVIDRMKRLFAAIERRKEGGRARRFCIGATNERYFADILAGALRSLVPTTLVIESESILPAGYEKPVNMKTALSDLYSAAVNENRYDLPSSEYVKNDHRAVIKSGGSYDCDVDPMTGGHGDTFDSGKFAEWALVIGGPFAYEAVSQAAESADEPLLYDVFGGALL